MNAIKQIFIDSLNGLSVDMIPLFLFQLLSAGLLGYLSEKALNKKFSPETVVHGALVAVLIALLTSLVKYSMPGAIMAGAAVVIFTGLKEHTFLQRLGILVVMLVGVGCGLGSVIQTALGFVLLLPVLLFMPFKK